MESAKNKIIFLSSLILLTIIIAFTLIIVERKTTEEIFLTKEEIAWLNDNKEEIKIGYTIDYPPVEFLINGKYEGMSADYFRLLEEKLGTKIQMVQFDNFDALLKQVEAGQITGITAATKTPERSKFLEFTVPYIDNPNVIITQKNFSEELTFEKLANTSMDILVIEGFDIIEFLNERYPKLKYRTVSSPSEGLSMVAFGEADAIIMEIMTASAIIEKNNISNIMVNVETPYESNLSIATRSDLPILNRILNKGLAQITIDERKAIEQKWVYAYRAHLLENPYFWLTILIMMVILIAGIVAISIWNASLQTAIREKTRALEESKKALMYKTYHDELTGLYNRIYLAEILYEYEEKNVLPFSIILADMNGLKITNDILGHEAGDRMLVRMADIVRNNISAEHIACRFGGDEILVLLPNTDENEAAQIVERISAAALNAEEDPVKPFAALGYATMEDCFDSNNYMNLFKTADSRMYANKIAEKEKVYEIIIQSIKKQLRSNKYEGMEHHNRLMEISKSMENVLDLKPELINKI